ncbi:hypothetical protein BH09BAC3_BH09BAC3_09840 [soil metagenome]
MFTLKGKIKFTPALKNDPAYNKLSGNFKQA